MRLPLHLIRRLRGNDTSLLVVLVFAFAALRLPYIFLPFQHPDEGTFVTYGAQTALNGAVFGIDYVDGRGPGGYLLYALFVSIAGFGNYVGLHLITLAYQCIILVLVYAIARQLFSSHIAVLSALLYVTYSYAFNIPDSVFLNVELLALLPLLLSVYIYLLIVAGHGKTWFLWVAFGLGIGLVFSVRQSMAIALPILSAHYIVQLYQHDLSKDELISGVGRMVSGIALGLGFGLVIGYSHPLLNDGIGEAIYATVLHGFVHPVLPWADRIINLVERSVWFTLTQPLLWVGFALAAISLLRAPPSNNVRLFLALIAGQLIGIAVMGRVAAHAFYPVIPFVCIVVAVWVDRGIRNGSPIGQPWGRLLAITGIVIPLFHFLVFPGGVLLKEYNVKSLFVEANAVTDPISQAAHFVKANSGDLDRIQTLSRSYAFMRFYVQSERLPSTRPYHSDFDSVWNQAQFADAMRDSKPQFVVLPSQAIGGIRVEESLARLLEDQYSLVRTFSADEGFQYRFYSAKIMPDGPITVKIFQRKTSELVTAFPPQVSLAGR